MNIDNSTHTLRVERGLEASNIPAFVRSVIEGHMSVYGFDTFEKASNVFQYWSNFFAVMSEKAGETIMINTQPGSFSSEQTDEAIFRTVSRESIAALALRVRSHEHLHEEDSATGQNLAYIACELEDGDYGARLAAHYDAFCKDQRTSNQTGLAASSTIADIGKIADIRSADDLLMMIIARAGQTTLSEPDFVEMTPEDEANIRQG